MNNFLSSRIHKSICFAFYLLAFSSYCIYSPAADKKQLEKEIIQLLTEKADLGRINSANFFMNETDNDEAYVKGLENFRAALQNTKNYSSFRKVARVTIDKDSMPERFLMGEENFFRLGATSPPGLILTLTSADPKEEIGYQNFQKEISEKLSVAQKRIYGEQLPLLTALKQKVCENESLSSLKDKSNLEAEMKVALNEAKGANFISSVEFHPGQGPDDRFGGSSTESLKIEFNRSKLKGIEVKKETNRYGTRKISLVAKILEGGKNTAREVTMNLNASCNFQGGSIWTFNGDGNKEKFTSFDYIGKQKLQYWVNREILPVTDIYESCEKNPDAFAEIIRLAEQVDRAIVTILDYGVDFNHPGLAYKIPRTKDGKIKGWDFADNDSLPYDSGSSLLSPEGRYRHGTHVAGIASMGSSNIEILPIRFSPKNPESNYEAVKLAHREGSRIINISLGSKESGYWTSLQKAMIDHPDILFVVGAGNEGENIEKEPMFPASFDLPNMIVVAAVDSQNKLAGFSNYGPEKVHVAANGVYVSSFLPENKEEKLSGTSQSAPHVSKIAAEIKLVNPKLTPEKIKAIIMESVDVRPELWGTISSAGTVNMDKALALAKSTLR